MHSIKGPGSCRLKMICKRSYLASIYSCLQSDKSLYGAPSVSIIHHNVCRHCTSTSVLPLPYVQLKLTYTQYIFLFMQGRILNNQSKFSELSKFWFGTFFYFFMYWYYCFIISLVRLLLCVYVKEIQCPLNHFWTLSYFILQRLKPTLSLKFPFKKEIIIIRRVNILV